jgi:hypothetical protein
MKMLHQNVFFFLEFYPKLNTAHVFYYYFFRIFFTE